MKKTAFNPFYAHKKEHRSIKLIVRFKIFDILKKHRRYNMFWSQFHPRWSCEVGNTPFRDRLEGLVFDKDIPQIYRVKRLKKVF